MTKESIYKLIYKSKINTQKITDLIDIIKKAEYKNKKLDLTGLLVRTNDEYIQILEGSKKHINQLFAKLYLDPRHKDVFIISMSQSEMRYFKNWSMIGIDLNVSQPKFYNYLLEKYSKGAERLILPEGENLALSFLMDVRYHVDTNKFND